MRDNNGDKGEKMEGSSNKLVGTIKSLVMLLFFLLFLKKKYSLISFFHFFILIFVFILSFINTRIVLVFVIFKDYDKHDQSNDMLLI